MKLLVTVLILGVALPAFAETIEAPTMKYDGADEKFHRDRWEITTGAAVYFSPFGATHNRRTADYALAVADAGYMLTDVKEWGVMRGNVEMIGEVFGGGIFEGKGNYVAGFTLSPRYNFVQPGWKIVPYFQLGAGITFTDVDHELVGQRFNFNLGGAVGVRYYIKPNLALNAEYRAQHISNANQSDHNVGINAQGGLIGVSWLY